jgi:hypothetical protein
LKQHLVNVIVDESKDPLDESGEEQEEEYNEATEEALWEHLPEVGASNRDQKKLGDKRK